MPVENNLFTKRPIGKNKTRVLIPVMVPWYCFPLFNVILSMLLCFCHTTQGVLTHLTLG